jgi:hypothetical protein
MHEATTHSALLRLAQEFRACLADSEALLLFLFGRVILLAQQVPGHVSSSHNLIPTTPCLAIKF